MSGPGTNDFVQFLRHYGPIAASDNMYDELIQSELDRYCVEPAILIPPARLQGLVSNFEAPDPVSVVLTGTAGDGKTFHCRLVWEKFGGLREDWQRGEKIARLRLHASGRELFIVKDLSELKKEEKAELLPVATDAILDENSSRVFLIAANDGQLLATWRDWAEASDERAVRAFKRLEHMLVDGHETDPLGELRLKLYNLSRLDPSRDFEELLEQVVEHPKWDDCHGCPLMQADGSSSCPIRINRERLRSSSNRNPFRRHLSELLSLAAANRLHLPIRHLLLLIVNIILGDQKPGTHLLTCRTAKRRAEQSEYDATNPYANVFGGNLPESQRWQYQAFTVLDGFGVGRETDNAIDNLLIYGGYSDDERYARLIASDSRYGAAAYQRVLHDYLQGDRTEIRAFIRALERQRQRLFFTLPDDEADLDPWRLTVYRAGGDFLAFCRRLREERETVRLSEDLVRGLNRTFCGMMIDETTALYLASSGGDGRGQIASVLNHVIAVKPRRRVPYLAFSVARDGIVPEIVVRDPEVDEIRFDLQLTHFEYLMRVAKGSLPASFSRQCYEDFLDFKLRLIEHFDRLEPVDDSGPEINFRSMAVDHSGRISLDEFPIRVGALCRS